MAKDSISSDGLVTARDVLRAISELRRLGDQRLMSALEQREPDLTEYLLEEHTAIYHQMLAAGVSPKALRGLSARVRSLALVLVQAMRQAHLRLWEQQVEANPRLEPLGQGGANGADSAPQVSDEDTPADAAGEGEAI